MEKNAAFMADGLAFSPSWASSMGVVWSFATVFVAIRSAQGQGPRAGLGVKCFARDEFEKVVRMT